MPLMDRLGGTLGYTIAATENRKAETGQTVECVTVSGICERYGLGEIGFLKMDIEGAEKEVLEHAEGWIGKVRILAVELHDRIVPGCEKAFESATAGRFARFEKRGDKSFAFADA
jgi:hypothetical protein